MSIFATVLLLSSAIHGAASPDWWDPAWTCRQRVYLDTTQVDTDLVDFPLSLFASGDRFATDAARPDGADLRAVSKAGELLPLEVTCWSKERVELHVLLPRIPARALGEYFDLYYGNPNALAEQAPAFTDKAYRAVLHLNGNLNDARTGEPAAQVAGTVKLADTMQLSGAEPGHLALNPQLLAGLGEQITVHIRFRFEAEPGAQTLVSARKTDGPEEWFNFGLKTPGTLHTNATSRGQRAGELNVDGLKPGQWHAAAVRYDARNKTRTLCIDGTILQSDTALTGPLEVNEWRVGQGMLHFEPWQVHGEIDEVRIAGEARSDAWMRAETACLDDGGAFVTLDAPQRFGEPMPKPGPVVLLDPPDGAQIKSRAGALLRWKPVPGAERYVVELRDKPDQEPPRATIDAGSVTQWLLPPAAAGAATCWSVRAFAASGESVNPARALSFYDWADTDAALLPLAVQPVFAQAQEARFDLQGYLRARIDRVIRHFFLEVPESSPAILQVLRDRDRTPLRDPLVPWAGEFAGKFLTAAQLTWRLTHDENLKNMIDAFAADLIACQQPDGYLGPFPKSSRLTGSNWDIWGHYHCMLGLMLYYEDTHFEGALDACKKAADLLFETFGTGGPTLTCDGSGGEMNMAVCHGLMLLYQKTGLPRYLELAKYIVHEAWNEDGAGHYLECALAGKPLIEMPRHRWESIHDWQALAELYWVTGDDQYKRAFEHLWRDGLRGDRHNTGGVTSGEGFQGTPFHDGAIETCCTVAWIAFSIDMLRLTGDSTVADEIEWSTLNSALGAIPYGGRVCAYNVPMDGTRVFGVELPWQAPKAGPDLNCCSVNANRPLGMISQWALMGDTQGLALNFYGPGSLGATLPSGNHLTLTQDTQYPLQGHVRIQITADTPEAFALKLRIPAWSQSTKLTVNGEEHPAQAGTYAVLNRTWQTGDVIDLDLDFQPRVLTGAESRAGQFSVFHGPLLLAYDARYNTLDPGQIPALDPQSLHVELQPWPGTLEPRLVGTLSDNRFNQISVCDFSSAGQTGNQYRSWLPAATPSYTGAELVSVEKIWDAADHNAFTDLIRYRDQWYCTFREANGHVKGDGKIRVIKSADAKSWESVALLEEAGIDLRDPKICETPDGQLMLVMGGSVYRDGQLVGRRPRVAFSPDGATWSAPEPVLDEGEWLWRVTWHKGRAYGTTYKLFDKAPADRILELVTSTDGRHWDRVSVLSVPDKPNETTLRFLPDDRMVALVRREAGNTFGWIGVSAPPYTDWQWRETQHRLGGPNFIQLPDGSLWAGTRLYHPDKKSQCMLARMTPTALEPAVVLPSEGDCSYPGLVWHDDMLWMSYYSSHEGKTSIYLAQFKMK